MKSKEERRAGARERFAIMPMADWMKSKYGNGTVLVDNPQQEDVNAYSRYVERKSVEMKALGINPLTATSAQMGE